jgi:hypothetical protein
LPPHAHRETALDPLFDPGDDDKRPRDREQPGADRSRR